MFKSDKITNGVVCGDFLSFLPLPLPISLSLSIFLMNNWSHFRPQVDPFVWNFA